MRSLSDLSIDELADGICLRAGRIAAAEAELLRWVAEFDRREGWAGPGMLSCAHWLSWRIGLSPGAARERVRVARRLEELPELAAAFADGRVSNAKVRAITRVAEPDDRIDWVSLARHSAAAQLEKVVRGVRRARGAEAAQADPELAQWKVRTRKRYDSDGNLVITITTRPQYAPVVEAGLEAKRAELQRELDARADAELAAGGLPVSGVPAGTPRTQPTPQPQGVDPGVEADAADGVDPDAPAPGWPQGTTVGQVRQAARAFTANWCTSGTAEETAQTDGQPATSGPQPGPDVPAGTPHVPTGTPDLPQPRVSDGDALLALAQEALAAEQTEHPDTARRRRPQLTAQIDPLSGWGRQADGEVLPPPNLRAVMKTLPGRGGLVRLRPVTEVDLRRFDLGRTAREVSPALRELLGTPDGQRCRFPGCTRHKKLHAHHVVYWSRGGGTDLSNLVLVCARHHTLIHAQGFQLLLHPDRRLEVHTADGVPVLHHPAQPWGYPAALAAGCGRAVSAGTLPPDHCETRLDLEYVVNVLLAQAA